MTRINCIPPEELSGKHLVAEYRELPRIFGLVEKAITRNDTSQLPETYTLGAGHCRFFYRRLGYLARRHKQLVGEMLKRGYDPKFRTPLESSFSHIPAGWWGDWEPDQEAVKVNRERIEARQRHQ